MNSETVHTLIDTSNPSPTSTIISSDRRSIVGFETRIDHLSDPMLAVSYLDTCGIAVMGSSVVETTIVGDNL